MEEDNSKYIYSVKADVQNDIYYLFTKNKNNILEKYDMACYSNL